jgi:hypothetical protein
VDLPVLDFGRIGARLPIANDDKSPVFNIPVHLAKLRPVSCVFLQRIYFTGQVLCQTVIILKYNF